jgi:hypothetical protein
MESHLNVIPFGVLNTLLMSMDVRSILTLAISDKNWKAYLDSDTLWQALYERDFYVKLQEQYGSKQKYVIAFTCKRRYYSFPLAPLSSGINIPENISIGLSSIVERGERDLLMPSTRCWTDIISCRLAIKNALYNPSSRTLVISEEFHNRAQFVCRKIVGVLTEEGVAPEKITPYQIELKNGSTIQ